MVRNGEARLPADESLPLVETNQVCERRTRHSRASTRSPGRGSLRPPGAWAPRRLIVEKKLRIDLLTPTQLGITQLPPPRAATPDETIADPVSGSGGHHNEQLIDRRA